MWLLWLNPLVRLWNQKVFSSLFLPEHPASDEHGAPERGLGRLPEGAAEVKGAGGRGARQGCRRSQHPLQWNEDGTDKVSTFLIGLHYESVKAPSFITWTLHYGNEDSALIDELGGRERAKKESTFSKSWAYVWLTMWQFHRPSNSQFFCLWAIELASCAQRCKVSGICHF